MTEEEKREAMKILGQRIRQIRLMHKLTQEEFGQIFGKSASTIYGYESGKVMPSAKVLFDISRLYHVSVHELFGLINKCVRNKKLVDEYYMTLFGDTGEKYE